MATTQTQTTGDAIMKRTQKIRRSAEMLEWAILELKGAVGDDEKLSRISHVFKYMGEMEGVVVPNNAPRVKRMVANQMESAQDVINNWAANIEREVA
jgi:hypothetical protein